MKGKKPQKTVPQLIEGVLAKNPLDVARMISLAERGGKQSKSALQQLYKHTGRAHIVGLTGVPGSGKSTLVNALITQFRAKNLSVAVIAIDPSSPFSGGAILGDRVRMGEHTLDDGVFIRSLATRGALGGLARACFDTLDILDAAGFDLILIETVGVGQDAVDISNVAETVVVVSAPGLGDEIQAIKAGVLEIADIHVVSKCDTDGWQRTASDLKAIKGVGLTGRDRHGWSVPVIATSADKNTGICELVDHIQDHKKHLRDSDEHQVRVMQKLKMRLLQTANDRFDLSLKQLNQDQINASVDKLRKLQTDPDQAADELLRQFSINYLELS